MASPLFGMIGAILGRSMLCDTPASLTTVSGVKTIKVHIALREGIVSSDGYDMLSAQKTIWFPEAAARDYRSSDPITIDGDTTTYYLAGPVALGDGMVRSGLSTSRL